MLTYGSSDILLSLDICGREKTEDSEARSNLWVTSSIFFESRLERSRDSKASKADQAHSEKIVPLRDHISVHPPFPFLVPGVLKKEVKVMNTVV